MNKKLVIIIVSVVVALALIVTGTVFLLKSLFSSGSGDTAISVGTVSASVGDTVKVPVKISGNPGFMAMLIDLEYDTEVLKYKSYKEGDFLTDYEVVDNSGKLKFMTLEDEDIDKNGVLVYLEFEVLSDKKASSEIKLTIGENSICNYDEEIITAKAENGKVEIK